MFVSRKTASPEIRLAAFAAGVRVPPPVSEVAAPRRKSVSLPEELKVKVLVLMIVPKA